MYREEDADEGGGGGEKTQANRIRRVKTDEK